MNKRLLSFAIALTGFIINAAPADNGEKIEFFRPSEPGKTCRIDAAIRSSSKVSVRPSSAPAKTHEKIEASAAAIAGTMKILECSDKGNPLVFEFTVESLSGNLRSDTVDTKNLAGKTILVKKTNSDVSFVLKDGGTITDPEKDILRMFFQPDDGLCLKDIIGTDALLKPGDSWKLAHEAKNGIGFSGMASLKGKETFAKTECWKIEYAIAATDNKGLFSDSITEILLPVEKEKGGPLQIKSKQKRKIEKALPAENPITAGNTLYVDEETEFRAVVLPLP